MNSDQQQQRIMGYFIEEAREHLQTIEQGVLNLQDILGDSESINELFRAAHSIKGGAAMLGVGSIQHIAHRLEDFFKIVKENPHITVDERLKSLLLAGFDPLAELLDELQISYKISNELSQETTGRVKPVFTELERYLASLTDASASVTDIDAVTASQVDVVKISDKPPVMTAFQQEVTTKMRDMLQVFRGDDTVASRSQLQTICDYFLAIADGENLPNWSNLVHQIKSAIAITHNSFRDLAPVIIRELKEAQDLVIANQETEITISHNLQSLLPHRPTQPEDDEISTIFTAAPTYFEDESLAEEDLNLSAQLPQEDVTSDIVDTFDISEESPEGSDMDLDFLDDLGSNLSEVAPIESDIDNDLGIGDSDLDLPDISSSANDQLDWMDGDYETVDDQSVDGPMVGASELKSLAILFENDDIDFESAWEDIESNETQITRQNLDDSSGSPDDFADLLAQDSIRSEGSDIYDLGEQDQSLGVDHLFGDFDEDENISGNLENNLVAIASHDSNANVSDRLPKDDLFPDDLTNDWENQLEDIPLDVNLDIANPPVSNSSLDALFEAELGDDTAEALFTDDKSLENITVSNIEDNPSLERNLAELGELFEHEEPLFSDELDDDLSNLDQPTAVTHGFDEFDAEIDSELSDNIVNGAAETSDEQIIQPFDIDSMNASSFDEADSPEVTVEPFALTSIEDEIEFLDNLEEPFAIDENDVNIGNLVESWDLDNPNDALQADGQVNSLEEALPEDLVSEDSQQNTLENVADLSSLFGDDDVSDITSDTSITNVAERPEINNLESPLEMGTVDDLDDFFAASEDDPVMIDEPAIGFTDVVSPIDDEDFLETADLGDFDISHDSEHLTDISDLPEPMPSLQSNSIEELDDFFSFGDSNIEDTEAIAPVPQNITAHSSQDSDLLEVHHLTREAIISDPEDSSSIDLNNEDDWEQSFIETDANDFPELELSGDFTSNFAEFDDLEQPDVQDNNINNNIDAPVVDPDKDNLTFSEWMAEGGDLESDNDDSWENDQEFAQEFSDLENITETENHDSLLDGLDENIYGYIEEQVENQDEQLVMISDTEDDLLVDRVTAETTLDNLVDFFQGDEDSESADLVSDEAENNSHYETISLDALNDVANFAETDLSSQSEDTFAGLTGDNLAVSQVSELNGIDDNFNFDDLEAMIDMQVVDGSNLTDVENNIDNNNLENTVETAQVNGIDFDDLEALLGNSGTLDLPLDVPKDDTDATVINTSINTSQPKPADDFGELEDMLHSTFAKDVGQIQTKAPSKPAATSRKQKLTDTTMRVDVKYLDSLNNLVGELVVNRNLLEQEQERLQQFITNLLHQVQLLSDVSQRMRDQYDRSLLEASLSAGRGRQNSFESMYANDGGSGSNAISRDFEGIEFDRYNTFHVLSQEIIELIVRVRESASDIEFVVGETDQVTRQLGTITTQVQDDLKQSRMVPFAQIADRLPRGVRDRSLKTGKQVDLEVFGRETLIDKAILESLTDPLTHLVNNAIDHGLEDPATRQAMGKSATGKLTVRAYHQGNQTVISISDDGAGIDPAKVKKSAVSKGVRTQAEVDGLSDNEVYGLLFEPGFSTAAKADEFKGRGVGLDVVKTCLDEIRGVIIVESAIGKGTSFIIRLPLTLSISKAMFCISDRARIAFPVDGFEDMVEVPQSQIILNEKGQPCLPWRDTVLPFQHLSNLLSYNRHLSRSNIYGKQENDELCIIILRNDTNYLALQVDQFLGEYEIVIKQLEGPIPQPAGVAGATVLGDGRVMAIANVLELFDIASGRLRPSATNVPMQPVVEEDIAVDPTVLIVDDSITVRELLSLTFAKVGYRVEQAKDGQDAWEKLRAGLPCDMIFCDIEMPRMDGLDLLSRLQKDSRLKQIPVAMLTSRGADRHRQSAIQLGAKGYFTKPYLEEELLSASKRLLNGETLPI